MIDDLAYTLPCIPGSLIKILISSDYSCSYPWSPYARVIYTAGSLHVQPRAPFPRTGLYVYMPVGGLVPHQLAQHSHAYAYYPAGLFPSTHAHTRDPQAEAKTSTKDLHLTVLALQAHDND